MRRDIVINKGPFKRFAAKIKDLISSLIFKVLNFLQSIKTPILISLLIAGSISLYLFTNSGRLGLTLDSMAYLSAANYFKTGELFKSLSISGVPELLSHYPFGISLILSIIPTSSVWQGFYILNISSFLISILLIFYLILKATKSNYISLFFSLIWTVSIQTLAVFSFSWSEPLFIALTLLIFVLWMKYNESKDSNIKYLFLISLVTSFMPLLRYAGLFLIPLNLLLLTILVPKIKEGLNKFWNNKWIKILGLMLIQSMPYLIWSKYLSITSGTIRVLEFNLIPIRKFLNLPKTIQIFFLNKDLNTYLNHTSETIGIIIILLLIFWVFIRMFNKDIKKIEFKTNFAPIYSSLFIAIYLLFLCFSMMFFDKNTPFDYRILSIITPYLIISLGILFSKYGHWIKWTIVVTYTVLLLVTSYSTYLSKHRSYYAYASPKYDQLEMIKMQKEDTSIGIITDQWEPTYARTGCDCARIARKQDVNDKYWDDIDKYIKSHKKTYIVETHFESGLRDSKYIATEEYLDKYSFRMVYNSVQERIYLIIPD